MATESERNPFAALVNPSRPPVAREEGKRESKSDRLTERIRSTQRVLEAVIDLSQNGRGASRTTICEFTGLHMQIVDDRIKDLKTDGRVRSLKAGLFEAVDMDPPRPVLGGIFTPGRFRLAVGNTELDMTLAEALNVHMLTAGVAQRLGR